MSRWRWIGLVQVVGLMLGAASLGGLLVRFPRGYPVSGGALLLLGMGFGYGLWIGAMLMEDR